MTSHKLTNLDMKELEEQLESAIQEDKKYWQQNEAKLQAVRDHVETYDDFKNLVDAAHLKPLDKTDKISKEKLTQTVWNKFADRGNGGCSESSGQFSETSKTENNEAKSDTNGDACKYKEESARGKSKAETSHSKRVEDLITVDRNNFLELLSQSDDQLVFLTNLGAARFVDIFHSEISTSTLLQVLQVLSTFNREDVDRAVFVAEFLGELINIERFSLTLSFLTSEEKPIVERLFEKLNSVFILKSDKVKEFGLDEDHLSALKIVYQL